MSEVIFYDEHRNLDEDGRCACCRRTPWTYEAWHDDTNADPIDAHCTCRECDGCGEYFVPYHEYENLCEDCRG